MGEEIWVRFFLSRRMHGLRVYEGHDFYFIFFVEGGRVGL